jgi:hypothetical protein
MGEKRKRYGDFENREKAGRRRAEAASGKLPFGRFYAKSPYTGQRFRENAA